VNKLAGTTGSAGCKCRLLQDQDRVTLRSGCLGYPYPMNAAADDYEIVALSQSIPRAEAAGSLTFPL